MKRVETQPEEHDAEEVARIALVLYERDRERDQDTRSVQQALKEMAVPPRYMEEARRQLEREKLIKKGYGKKRSTWPYLIGAFVVVAAALLVSSFWNYFVPAKPQTLVFDHPFSHWSMDVAGGTEASFSGEIVDGQPVGKITLTRLGEKPQSYQTYPRNAPFSVRLYSIQQDLDMHGLTTATFRARGNGIRGFRVAARSGDFGNVSPKMTLTKDWQTYDIDLRRLRQDDYYPNTFIQDPDTIAIELSSATNGADEAGTMEIGPITVH